MFWKMPRSSGLPYRYSISEKSRSRFVRFLLQSSDEGLVLHHQASVGGFDHLELGYGLLCKTVGSCHDKEFHDCYKQISNFRPAQSDFVLSWKSIEFPRSILITWTHLKHYWETEGFVASRTSRLRFPSWFCSDSWFQRFEFLFVG